MTKGGIVLDQQTAERFRRYYTGDFPPLNQKVIVVVAGSYRQFVYWAHYTFQELTESLLYADEVDRIVGLFPEQVKDIFLVGDWWESPIYGEHSAWDRLCWLADMAGFPDLRLQTPTPHGWTRANEIEMGTFIDESGEWPMEPQWVPGVSDVNMGPRWHVGIHIESPPMRVQLALGGSS